VAPRIVEAAELEEMTRRRQLRHVVAWKEIGGANVLPKRVAFVARMFVRARQLQPGLCEPAVDLYGVPILDDRFLVAALCAVAVTDRSPKLTSLRGQQPATAMTPAAQRTGRSQPKGSVWLTSSANHQVARRD
jgi:hypothetical protein